MFSWLCAALAAGMLIVSGQTFAVQAQYIGPLVSDLDWSPDGQRVAAATGRWEEAEWAGGPQLDCESVFGLYFIDAATSEVTFMEIAGLLCSPTTIDFNPAGREIAYTYFSGFGAIDLSARRVRQAVTAYTFYHSIFWHPDGNSALVTANYGIGSVAYNLIDGAPGPSIGRPGIPDAGFSFRYGVWSPDATRIAATTTAVDGRIYIVRGNQVERAFAQHTAPVRRFVWNPATNLIASGDDTGRVLVWNPDSGEVVRELAGHTGPILDIDWRPNGSQIATASQDGTLRVWNWPSGSMQIVDTANVFSAVAYSPDGSQLAYGGEIIDSNNVQIDIVPVSQLVPTPTPAPFQRVRPIPSVELPAASNTSGFASP
jgi:dipeptidyl aminopeptidase/acylaminoacyl peptidase